VVVGGGAIAGFGGAVAWLGRVVRHGSSIARLHLALVLGEGPEEAAEGGGLGPHHARHEAGLGVHHPLDQVQLGVQQILLESNLVLDKATDIRELGFGQAGKRQLGKFWKCWQL